MFLRNKEIEVKEIKSKLPGANVVIIAGIHGNEKCGIKAFKHILPNLKIQKGKITFIIANKKAISKNKRFIEKDLNRCFNSNKNNYYEERISKEIKKILNNSDAMLDIHSSFSKKSEPFCICEKHSLKTASYLPTKKIVINIDKFHHGSTDEYMNKRKKIGICIECGSNNSKNSTKVAINSIKRFCSAMKLIDRKYKKQKQNIFKITKLHKNKTKFKLKKEINDFRKIKRETTIGTEENNKIKVKKNDIILFAKNQKEANKECFLIAKKINTNINK